MIKYICISLFVLFTFLLPSCEDHFETGVEGSWQLTHITQANGTQVSVDTIFYRFKKGVFQYQAANYKYSVGMYEEKGDSLFITMKDYLNHFPGWDGNGGDLSRNFKIEKLASKKMILRHKDDNYHFRIF